MNVFYECKEAFLDLIFPANIYCICCNQPIYNESYSICKSCQKEIKWITYDTCIQCGKPLALNFATHKCPDCVQTKHFFTQGFSCMVYDHFSKKMIHGLKFYNKGYYSKYFAELIFDKLKNQHIKFDYIIPVPLHKKRRKERGYNQSQLISYYLSKLSLIPILSNVLIRTRDTLPQNQLSLSQRKHNLKNAFKIRKPFLLFNKRILLIDDIYTTGNTVNACSKELLIHKASEVYVATCAIGVNT